MDIHAPTGRWHFCLSPLGNRFLSATPQPDAGARQFDIG
jgi:hypothetical protein